MAVGFVGKINEFFKLTLHTVSKEVVYLIFERDSAFVLLSLGG